VSFGQHVILSHLEREPSELPWDQIKLVYDKALGGMVITIKNVDELLGNANAGPAGRDASTMCALVSAMMEPSRVNRA
jgi:hypothetical protein